MLIVAPTFLPHTPPVQGGIVGKPYPYAIHGQPLRCTPHLYSDGLIIRCTTTTKKGAA